MAAKTARGSTTNSSSGRGRQKRWTLSDVPALEDDLPFNNAKTEIQQLADKAITLASQSLKSSKPDIEAAEELLASELSGVLPWITPSETQSTTTWDELPRSMAQLLNQVSRRIVSYDAVNKQATGITQPTRVRWEDDIEDLHQLNQSMLDMAEQDIMKALMAGSDDVPQKLGDETGHNRIARKLMQTTSTPRGDTWGGVAQAQVEALTRTVRALGIEKPL